MFYTNQEILSKYSTEYRIWQGIPSIEVTKKGRIFLTFYSGGTDEEIGNYAVLLKSDSGCDFSEPIAVAIEEGHRCYDPCLWIDPLDRLWFTWACAPDHAVYGVVCENPDADILEWGSVQKIGNDVMMNKPIVKSNREWLFPIAVWERRYAVGTEPSDDPDRKAFVYSSYDGGKSFRKMGGVAAYRRVYDEHMVLERKDGTLAMYIRTEYGIAVSYSYDGGTTWTEAEDSGLGGPCSRFHIRRLKSGRILLINHVDFCGRNNLTALLSEDEGETWKYRLLLDGRNDVSYPDAKEAEGGYIYITYDRDRGSSKKNLNEVYTCAREILMAKIKEDDIIAGKLTDPGSRLKMTASKLGEYRGEDQNPYHEWSQYSELEIAELLKDQSVEKIVKTLFENYRINCMSMHWVDGHKMDELIEQLEDGDKKEIIYQLAKLIRGVQITQNDNIPVIARVKELIENNIGQNLTLDEIAESMNMSKFYLCHLFKSKTNMTLTSWKNYLKLEKAKEFLADSPKKITEIAAECGFENVSYFTELFKKTEKLAPEAYREQIRLLQ